MHCTTKDNYLKVRCLQIEYKIYCRVTLVLGLFHPARLARSLDLTLKGDVIE